ncbi:MAG: stage V sporulation T C-terminal domain-containing protein [Clostridia bacterium]
MKATGIVRRIDDLGRVVIPKEIRKTLHIGVGTPLEIFTSRDGEIIFKKYSPFGEISEFSNIYTNTLSKKCDVGVIITDNDVVISASGVPKKELLEHTISSKISKIISARNPYFYKPGDTMKISVLSENDSYLASLVIPIITNGDTVGSVICVLPETGKILSESFSNTVTITSELLAKQLEE